MATTTTTESVSNNYLAPCPDCGTPVKWWRHYTSLTNEHRNPSGQARCRAIQEGKVEVITGAPLLRCEVPNRPPNLANARGGHWSVVAGIKKQRSWDVHLVALSARAAAQRGPTLQPARLRATVHFRGRRPDEDNAIANVKADVDGLVKAGWLKDDNPIWMPKPPVIDSKRLPKYQDREYTVWELFNV